MWHFTDFRLQLLCIQHAACSLQSTVIKPGIWPGSTLYRYRYRYRNRYRSDTAIQHTTYNTLTADG